jgi:hypothetical protein
MVSNQHRDARSRVTLLASFADRLPSIEQALPLLGNQGKDF